MGNLEPLNCHIDRTIHKVCIMSKKSSWEFVGELSNTTCVFNCEKQGHEEKVRGSERMQKRNDGALSSCARSLLSRTLISRVIPFLWACNAG